MQDRANAEILQSELQYQRTLSEAAVTTKTRNAFAKIWGKFFTAVKRLHLRHQLIACSLLLFSHVVLNVRN